MSFFCSQVTKFITKLHLKSQKHLVGLKVRMVVNHCLMSPLRLLLRLLIVSDYSKRYYGCCLNSDDSSIVRVYCQEHYGPSHGYSYALYHDHNSCGEICVDDLV